MGAAVSQLPDIAPAACRWVAEHCEAGAVAHVQAYRAAVARVRTGRRGMPERILSVLDGNTFGVSDRLGDLRPDAALATSASTPSA